MKPTRRPAEHGDRIRIAPRRAPGLQSGRRGARARRRRARIAGRAAASGCRRRETGIPSFDDEGFREPLRLLLRRPRGRGAAHAPRADRGACRHRRSAGNPAAARGGPEAVPRHRRRGDPAPALRRGIAADREHAAASPAGAGSRRPRGPGLGGHGALTASGARALRDRCPYRPCREAPGVVRPDRAGFQADPSPGRRAAARVHRHHERLVREPALSHDLPRALVSGVAGRRRPLIRPTTSTGDSSSTCSGERRPGTGSSRRRPTSSGSSPCSGPSPTRSSSRPTGIR